MKISSIKSKQQIAKLKKSKHKYVGKYFLLLKIKSTDEDRINYLIIVTKKVGNSVVRNKIKRRFRYLLRSNVNIIPASYDYLLIAKNTAVNCSYQEMQKDFIKMIGKK